MSVPPVGAPSGSASAGDHLVGADDLDRPRRLDGRERVAERASACRRRPTLIVTDAGDAGDAARSGRRGSAARREAEEVGAAADDVVLAEAAEDDVVAAAALDVVLAVGRRLERRDDVEVADVVADERRRRGAAVQPSGERDAPTCERRPANARSMPPSPWMTSLPSWPKIRSWPGRRRGSRCRSCRRPWRRVRRVVDRELDVEAVELVAQVVVVEVDEVLGPPRVRVEARAVRIAVRLPDAVDEQQPAVVLRRPGCRTRRRSAGRCGCRAASRRASGSGRSSC